VFNQASQQERAVQDPKEIIFAVGWQMPIHAWSFDRASLTRKKQKIGEEEIRCVSLAAEGNDWFGPHFLTLTCDIPESGRHAIYVEAVKGPGQAKVQLFQNENPIADSVDLYADQPARSGRMLLGRCELMEGKNNVTIKLVGKNEQSSGLGLDLIQLICVREQ
jgi:hypothetical protein